MAVGRKPKPTHLKLIAGNPGKRAVNRNEPRVAGAMPEPPEHLCSDGKAEWARVAIELHQSGILTALDRSVLAAYCQAYGRWISAERILHGLADLGGASAALISKTQNCNLIQNPLVEIANKAMADMVRYAAEFGMTPIARARVSATPDDLKNDPASRFLD